jgi:DNA-binding transcriptional LysR family regulator
VLGAVPGATPGKWIAAWRDRMPHVSLELREISVDDQRAALESGAVDAALVRLPLEEHGLHVIALYDEVVGVVVAAESALTAVDELDPGDLAGEVVIVPRDAVTRVAAPGTVEPSFAPPQTTADAIATVAAGVGVVSVPMSLARLHARKDVAFRAVRGAEPSRVALAWRRDADTPDVQTFVGIVRGRTRNSSR